MIGEQSFDTAFLYELEQIYNKYGDDMFKLDGIDEESLDIVKFREKFFSKGDTTADVSIDANSNVTTKDVISYRHERGKPLSKLASYHDLWLELRDMFGVGVANDMLWANILGSIYINDFTDVQLPYCFNFDPYDIMLQGLPMVDKIRSLPPKHLFSFKSQLEQFLVVAANSTKGATGLATLFVVMGHYVEKILDNMSDSGFSFKNGSDVWRYVKETVTSLVYTINQPMRGDQSPFTNVSLFDDNFMDQIIQDYPWNGRLPKKRVIQELQRVFCEVMNEELERTPVTFPVTTACLSVDDDLEILDEPFLYQMAEATRKWGFVNFYAGKSSTLSSCCRLRSDTDNEYFNSFGAGSSKIGSLGVVTVNIPQLAFRTYGRRDEFFAELSNEVNLANKINLAKRSLIKKAIDVGAHPLYTHGFMDLRKQYCTVGVTGLAEACHSMGFDIKDPYGVVFVTEVLEFINQINDTYSSDYGHPTNTEQVPAENSSITLANKDFLLGFNSDAGGKQIYPLYSNQFIPLTENANVLDRIMLQGVFDKHMSGGSILHINLDNRVSTQDIVDIVKYAVKKGVIYFNINYNLQRCFTGHMSVGNSDTCQICGEPVVDNFTKVVGFLTNTKNWHKTRRTKDYPNRRFYEKLN
jgi:ribonucleoside-triphosphate reductase